MHWKLCELHQWKDNFIDMELQEFQNIYSLYGINDGENAVAHPTSNLWVQNTFAATSSNRHIILLVLLYYMKSFSNDIVRLLLTIPIKSEEQYSWIDLKTSKILKDACWPVNVLLLSSSSSRSGLWQDFWPPEVCFWWCGGLLYWCWWVSVSVLDPEGRCMFVSWLVAPDGNSSGNSKSSHFRSLKNLSWCIV